METNYLHGRPRSWMCSEQTVYGPSGPCSGDKRDVGALMCGCGAVVAHHLAKVRVAGSNPVNRSNPGVAGRFPFMILRMLGATSGHNRMMP